MKKIFIFSSVFIIIFFNGCATSNAIKHDSKEIWKGTKDVSKEAWNDTKHVSKKVWRSSKNTVHNATAE